MTQNSVLVPALEKALDILEYLVEAEGPASLKTLSADLQIPASSAHRIAKTLVKRGYISEFRRDATVYSTGPKIPQLFYTYSSRFSIASAAKPIMASLSNNTGQTSQLAIMNNQQFIYIEQVTPAAPVNVMASLHTPIAINHSAGAKSILANMSRDFQVKYLESAILEKRTRYTVTDRSKLLEELQQCRSRGYAVDYEEFALGIGCVAAPIFSHGAACMAAVGVTGHIDHYNEPGSFEQLAVHVLKAAQEISRSIGFVNWQSAIGQ